MVFLASYNNKPKKENIEGIEKEVTELPVGEAKKFINKNQNIKNSNIQIVKDFLNNYGDISSYPTYLSSDVVYISLNENDDPLKKIMVWAGRHEGIEEFAKYSTLIANNMIFHKFDVEYVFGEGEDVAVFGTIEIESKNLKQKAHSPFAIRIKVQNGKINHFQFFEDTYETASTYRVSGKWNISNSNGEFEI